MPNIAIIPARSGSKGLANKNILPLLGKPLMAYTIEAALDSACFEQVFVSTDSEQYAELAVRFGASVPFLRSERSATDTASTWEVVGEVLTNYKDRGVEFDTVSILQPTSPLRNSKDICAAMEIYFSKGADYVESLCEMEHSPLWSNTIDESLSLYQFIKPEYNVRRQELPKYYRKNGAIYILKTEKLGNLGDLYSKNSYAYLMPIERSIDIDTPLDFAIAEVMLKQQIAFEP